MVMTFSMRELSHRSYFGHITTKLDTSAFLRLNGGYDENCKKHDSIETALFN